MVETIYRDVDRRLWPAAARQILAYLIALEREGRVTARPSNAELTPEQRALLDPDLGAIANKESAAVVRAELGFGTEAPRLGGLPPDLTRGRDGGQKSALRDLHDYLAEMLAV